MAIECERKWQQNLFTQVYCETMTINIHHAGRLLVRQQIEPFQEAFQDSRVAFKFSPQTLRGVSVLIRPHVQLFLCWSTCWLKPFLSPAWTMTHFRNIWSFSIIKAFITNRKWHQEGGRGVIYQHDYCSGPPKISQMSNLCNTLESTTMTHVGVPYPACGAGPAGSDSPSHVAATCGNKQGGRGVMEPEGRSERTGRMHCSYNPSITKCL